MLTSVTCKKEGFRRAGRVWPAGPTVLELSAEDHALLAADPMFVVEAAAADGQDKKPGKGAK